MEEFHSLDNIKAHFETWRKLYFTCYRDAYIGLCLPKLFNPLIRLQLISWSPLEVQKTVFFSSRFHDLHHLKMSYSAKILQCRWSVLTLSTCCGLSLCSSMAVESRAPYRKRRTWITACFLLLWKECCFLN